MVRVGGAAADVHAGSDAKQEHQREHEFRSVDGGTNHASADTLLDLHNRLLTGRHHLRMKRRLLHRRRHAPHAVELAVGALPVERYDSAAAAVRGDVALPGMTYLHHHAIVNRSPRNFAAHLWNQLAGYRE